MIPAALLKFIPGGPQLVMGTVLVVGLGIAGTGIWFKARSVYLKQGRAEVQAVLDRAISDHNAAAMAASDAYRRLEQALNTRIQEAQDALLKERAAATQVVAALTRARTERNGLRDQINALKSGDYKKPGRTQSVPYGKRKAGAAKARRS